MICTRTGFMIRSTHYCHNRRPDRMMKCYAIAACTTNPAVILGLTCVPGTGDRLGASPLRAL